jgi:pantetheine-phosphate adenylyltransferase
LTNGHIDIIERSARLFDRVIVAVLVNAEKRPLFEMPDRVAMIREALAHLPNIEIESFEGLLAEFVRSRSAQAVVRGLRSTTEFNDEWQMAQMNRRLAPDVETVFLVPAPDVAYVSSRLVKDIARLGGPLEGLVPPGVAARLSRRKTEGPRT